VGDSGAVTVLLDASERVVSRSIYSRRKVNQGPLDHLRWQLRRLSRRCFPPTSAAVAGIGS
jgi:hypothetical protein